MRRSRRGITPDMQHQMLGASPLRVSRVIFGSMGFASAPNPAARIELIQAAIDAGVDTVDTAPLYEFGDGERLIGRALGQLSRRPTLLTKVGLRWDIDQGEPLFTAEHRGQRRTVRRNSRPESIWQEIERSRERLGLDVLDLVQVHQRDYGTPLDETMGALKDAYRQGSIRAIGVSNFEPYDIVAAQRALNDVPLASVQAEYSLLSRSERELASARQTKCGFLAYSPLAQGLLTGAYGPRRALPEGDWRFGSDRFSVVNRTRIDLAIRAVLEPIAKREDRAISAVALAWALARPGVSAVIVGASSPAQIAATAAAAGLWLSEDDRRSIDATFDALELERRPPSLFGLLERARSVFRRLRDR